MKLTKEECELALNIFGQLIFTSSQETLKPNECEEYRIFEQLINEHFEFQLTSQEIDLIRYALRPLEDELGMDVTLLMDKLWRMVDTLPKEEGVVTCVEFEID